jgi:predicted Rossmann-fold nucleotide-binding protein
MPQEQSSAYKIAYTDMDFMLSDVMRPARLLIEHTKVSTILDKAGIESTIVIFGSARIRPMQSLLKTIAEIEGRITVGDPKAPADLAKTKKLIDLCRHYDEARTFARIVAQHSDGKRLVVMTGGGPGIMEAANRGAHDAGAESIGLNITLPHEQHPNPYVTPEFCFSFHYFSIRKMQFLTRCKALVACPGGFGTFVSLARLQ